MSRNKSGLTAVELVIVLIIIVVLAAIILPRYLAQRDAEIAKKCVENLTKIAGAKTSWALDMKRSTGAAVDMSVLALPDGSGWLNVEPICPAGGIYSVNPLGKLPTCSLAEDGTRPVHYLPPKKGGYK